MLIPSIAAGSIFTFSLSLGDYIMPRLVTEGGVTMVGNIIYSTHGRTHGPITRLVSPSDLGEVMKPFVFLDLARFDGRTTPMRMEESP